MIVSCKNCHLKHEIPNKAPGVRLFCRCQAELITPELDANSEALTCPQCGGQADYDLANCQHCDSALATVRCADCYGMVFAGHAHCQHCGGGMDTPIEIVFDHDREALSCPRCETDMHVAVIEKTLIDGCAHCGGLWLDHKAFARVRQQKEFKGFIDELNIPSPVSRSDPATQKTHNRMYVPCPVCNQFMHRRNYAKYSNIIVDVCAKHGIWFDTNELAKALTYRMTNVSQFDPVPGYKYWASYSVCSTRVKRSDVFSDDYINRYMNILKDL